MSSPQTTTDLSAVADAIRAHEKFLVTTHENPAGDAPLPREYSWMPLAELRRTLPDDVSERVLLALDCANESRLGPDPEVLHSSPLVVDVDHHHDNSRFGAVNLVVA